MPKAKQKTKHLSENPLPVVKNFRRKRLSAAEIREALIDSDDDDLPAIDIYPEENDPDTRTQTEFITRELPVFIGETVSYGKL